ncbi:MAG TPA: cytochrome c [Terracidiphilus sp.]|nr:cytochrome c [Terracidiphilus sp.]
MTKMIRTLLVLTAAVSLAGTLAFADSGEATYKAKCATCHGSAGTPSPGIAKMMGVKPASNPSVKALSVAEMTAVVKSGKGKMKPVAGLTDAQIKDVVTYFRTLK